MAQAETEGPAIGLPHGELHRGERIGKYEVVTLLSVGGMAELFLAFTSGLGGFRKFVVVKRILPDSRSNDHFVKMFLDEARITAALNHPNIAQVFDLGDDGGVPFIAMEFISGQNLNQIAKACHSRKWPIPIGFVTAVARDICLALHHAHTFTDPSGKPFPIIHRDVAQKNVMVTYEGMVKLLDFGIAKARGSLGRTSVGMVKGTTGYMSPEQVRGEELDGRSDVFSMGVMLHEVLTGRRLFAAETEAEEMEHILAAPIPNPSDIKSRIPTALSQVVMTALARNRDQRFPNARALAKALEGAVGRQMFDQDRRAAFMRELFEDRLAATRALLDSAGANDETTQVRRAGTLLVEDTGMTFPEAPQSDPARRIMNPLPPPDSETIVITDPAGVRPLEISSEKDPVVPTNPARLPQAVHPLLVGGLLGLVVLVAIYVLVTSFGREPRSEPVPPPSPIAAIPKPAGASALPHGTLTLETMPECEVFGVGGRIGRTPMVNVSLPVGLNKLRLLGPDQRMRVLSVPIREGENTSYKISLADLPFE